MVVIPFTILGQVLARTGGADFFADMSMTAMGRFRGGAAKIAVVGSALFGMISGSAVSNVLAVGIVTIPTMVRSGFTPYRAAAIGVSRIDGRAIDAAGDGRGRLHHGGIPAGALRRGLYRRHHTGSAVLRLPVLPRRPRSRQTQDRRGQDRRRAEGLLEVLKSGWHFLVPIAFSRSRTDVSGHHLAHAGESGHRRDRHTDGAGDDFRLSRQAAAV